MMRNINWVILLFFCGLSSCDLVEKRERKKCEGEAVLLFDFDIPYRASPARDTFTLGDTVWIESVFSSQMLNKRNGKTYSVSDFNFKISGVLLDLESNPCLPAAGYDMVNAAGQRYTADRSGNYFYLRHTFDGASYRWKAGFVLQQKGLFAFLPDTNIDDSNLKQQSPPQQITSCNYESVNLNIIRQGIAPHTYLLMQAADPYVREPWDIGPFEQAAFAFYVKD
jgi:hypothetical protein